ncbi:F0F1 ATP synthase subunit delta [Spiroplasma platyhelix]|uniref:ATP synthase subunit delta n=1 Tax=Spiroplasma platyhelix PALS-1 TaxID=1276218 RepID=A0A846TWP0_9MOLU|nr:F0F1 ATP synthase subunit delta [Spiroplasma platyhelix]MBE4704229.1 ATP synthase subunit delta [Spiroplasma platyhelix PALS-1]NKE38602.1 F0F1 ATP synthase subunit delta [Spiroplasma platyhelix PALS-1]UJB28813.1 F0F1 ATP synthase subunit delta [Spiroplasma platyhelix PALS-1]
MINETIVTNWSHAFFQLIVEEKEVKEYSDESVILIDLFTKYQDFLHIIDSAVLPFSEKATIIRTTFKQFAKYMVNFLLLLAQENCFCYVLLILKEFRKECNAYYGVQYGVVYSVVPLSSTQMKKLEAKVKLVTKQTVELVNKIDENLIAGVKIKVKNQVFDGSVKAQVDQLRNDLLRNNQEGR